MTLHVWERAEAVAAGAPEVPAVRRSRKWLAWGVLVVVLGVIVTAGVLAVRRSAFQGVPLDPGNSSSNGARALASVLEARGVEVEVARGQDALLGTTNPGGSTTVVVTSTGELSDETARRFRQHVEGAGRVVLVQPGRFVLRALDLPVEPADGAAPTDAVSAGCALDGLARGDRISTEGRTYDASGPGASECFAFDGAGAVVVVPAGPGLPETLVVGAGPVLANGEITRHDNAGVAVRLLARGDRVLWYVPSQLDIAATDETATSEIPDALAPLLFLGLFGLLALMLWRGRRFGPLVSEPLPAVVKAIETTHSRGRLYRRARDTDRAADALRTACARRLAGYLGLPLTASRRTVAAAAASATGRPLGAVVELLDGLPPAGEDHLVALAHDLSTLEKDVHSA